MIKQYIFCYSHDKAIHFFVTAMIKQYILINQLNFATTEIQNVNAVSMEIL